MSTLEVSYHLVEFDLLFEQFNTYEKKYILDNVLRKNISKSKPFLTKKDGEYSAGYLNSKIINEINNMLDFKVTDLIFVTADYKEKKLKTDKAYIKMNDFATYSQIPLFENQSQKVNQNSTNVYFYLYYKIEGEKTLEKTENCKSLQKALISFLEKETNSLGKKR